MPTLTHLALHVRDFDACLEFYQDFCGLVVSHERGEGVGRVVWLAEKGREHEFIFVLLPIHGSTEFGITSGLRLVFGWLGSR